MRRTIIYFLVVFWLSACDGGRSQQTVKLPLYEGCVEEVSEYARSMKEKFKGTDQELNIFLSYFDFKSKIHQDIVGFIQIDGQEVRHFELDVNTIKGMCFPETVETIGKDELGLRIVNNRIAENKSKGIKTYFEITEDKYILYYNEPYRK